MKIGYGLVENHIDITNICNDKLSIDNIITIPDGELRRVRLFSDPIVGTLKKIIIWINDIVQEYSHELSIKINIINNNVETINPNELVEHKLTTIQSKLQIKYGTFKEELPEQKMATRYLNGNEKVLEIGGNIGRNSLIIGSILSSSSNLVVLECDDLISKQLVENRELNGLNFHIEDSALSKRNLIQKGWTTIVSDVLLKGYKKVNTITYNDLMHKYNIVFDTLVIDCEGAFYYILMDMPEVLDSINLIIMENDYTDITHKKYVDSVLKTNGFYIDYVESINVKKMPCNKNFFEVWKK